MVFFVDGGLIGLASGLVNLEIGRSFPTPRLLCD